jgi:hypothetical protein
VKVRFQTEMSDQLQAPATLQQTHIKQEDESDTESV